MALDISNLLFAFVKLKKEFYFSKLLSPNILSNFSNCEGISNAKESFYIVGVKLKVFCAFVWVYWVSVLVILLFKINKASGVYLEL